MPAVPPVPTSPSLSLPSFRTQAERDRDVSRLGGVHPYLAQKVLRALNAMEVLGWPMFVTAGLRTDDEQKALYAQGRSTPGDIVTNCNGVTTKSMHQRQADGYGHAIDCAFLDDPMTVKIETWDDKQPWQVYGVLGEAFGLTWGGRWVSITDRPHLELALLSPFSAITTTTGG